MIADNAGQSLAIPGPGAGEKVSGPGKDELILDGFVFAGRRRLSMAKLAVRSARVVYARKRAYNFWDFKRLEQLTVLIERYYKSDYRVSFYSAELKITPRTLNRLTSFALGQTVYQLVLDRRIKEARVLLREEQKYMKEVACELGFKSAAGFGRFFKEMTGMSAREYRIWCRREALVDI